MNSMNGIQWITVTVWRESSDWITAGAIKHFAQSYDYQTLFYNDKVGKLNLPNSQVFKLKTFRWKLKNFKWIQWIHKQKFQSEVLQVACNSY